MMTNSPTKVTNTNMSQQKSHFQRGGTNTSAGVNTSHNTSTGVIDTFLKDEFQLVKAMPADINSLAREIRFNMAYMQANRLSQSAKWLGELLITLRDQNTP